MKRLNFIWVIILIIVAGCSQSGIQSEDIITVDVTANYPYKELILQDFMDVEYIPLETKDDFICQGRVVAVGKDVLIVRNHTNDGDIFIFSRNGKALRKINKKGQGGEEYTYYSTFVLDENKNELFVNDAFSKKILVYDLEGNFKRKLPHKDNFLFFEMYNFDRDNLICHDSYNDNCTGDLHVGQSFIIISKQDGSITKEIQIPFEKKETIKVVNKDEASGLNYVYLPSTVHPIVPYFENYVLVELSADTVYGYSPDHTMKPLIVRTPSIGSMKPEEFLLLSIITDRYYFMEAVEKTIEFSFTNIVYDKQENALYRYKVYNDDYNNDEEAFLKSRPLNGEIPSCQYLEAWKLVQDYKGGRLKGRLKEIAAKLDPEDNPVIMLIKHKK